jgi:hypothetical protein
LLLCFLPARALVKVSKRKRSELFGLLVLKRSLTKWAVIVKYEWTEEKIVAKGNEFINSVIRNMGSNANSVVRFGT